MTLSKLIFALAAAAAATASGAAYADHFHYGPRVRLYVGPGWTWVEPVPRYYVAPVVVVPAAPPVYVEQASSGEVQAPVPQAQAPANDWYYCAKPEGYYPYVKECPGGWQRVAPRPPQS